MKFLLRVLNKNYTIVFLALIMTFLVGCQSLIASEDDDAIPLVDDYEIKIGTIAKQVLLEQEKNRKGKKNHFSSFCNKVYSRMSYSENTCTCTKNKDMPVTRDFFDFNN